MTVIVVVEWVYIPVVEQSTSLEPETLEVRDSSTSFLPHYKSDLSVRVDRSLGASYPHEVHLLRRPSSGPGRHSGTERMEGFGGKGLKILPF